MTKLVALAFLAPALSVAQVVTLLCTASVGGAPILDRVIKIDYAKQLVDDAPAAFYDSEIRWVTVFAKAGKVEYVDNTLNRLSGAFQQWQRGAIYPAPPPVYACTRAPALKF